MWVSLQGIGSKGDTKIFGNNFNLLPNVLVRKYTIDGRCYANFVLSVM